MELRISAVKEKQDELEYYCNKYGFSLQPNDLKYELLLNLHGLELIQKNSQTKALKLDWSGELIRKRLRQLNKELLIKALGKKNKNQFIVDATAGLAQDAFLMQAAGHRVLMMERSNIVAAMLESSLKNNPSFSKNTHLLYGDARKLLQNMTEKPDIIYLDPMFPKTSKNAAQKKGMQFFREILSHSNLKETQELLQVSLKTAKKRVIVKRPIKAQSLNNQKPSVSLKGKTTRFDIYIT